MKKHAFDKDFPYFKLFHFQFTFKAEIMILNENTMFVPCTKVIFY